MNYDDDEHDAPVTRYQSPPLLALTPTPLMPSLPSSSGAWLGTRTTILKKDAAFIEMHTHYLRARRAQSDSMTGLVESRMSAALAMAKLTALPEIAQHEYDKGRLDRAHDMRMKGLSHQRTETDAEAELLEAQQRMARLLPRPPERSAPPPPPAPTGLTTADVEKVAQAMPELKPETIQSLLWALGGLLAEKNK